MAKLQMVERRLSLRDIRLLPLQSLWSGLLVSIALTAGRAWRGSSRWEAKRCRPDNSVPFLVGHRHGASDVAGPRHERNAADQISSAEPQVG